ncbi:hypothetical protein [Natronospora cellulosivora (SeqCode)]
MRRYIFLFLLIILLFSVKINAEAANDNHSLDLIMIVIDRLSIEELILTDTANIDYLQKEGAFSLMNVRTAGYLHPESTYLTAGAGNRCQGSKISHKAKSYGEGALNRKISELSAINLKTNYQAKPGLLGDIARDNDISIAVIGNSDNIDAERRTIISMVMDSDGFVPYADISKEILKEVPYPWAYQSDFAKMEKRFLEYKEKANTIVIETGDISRIEEFYQSRKEEDAKKKREERELPIRETDGNYKEIGIREIQEYKAESLKKIDQFIGFIIENIKLEETQLVIFAPTPSYQSLRQNENMSWLLISGRDLNHGFLSSTSTRRKGIISISDILPLFFMSNQIQAYNNLFSVYEEEVNWDILSSLNQRVSFIYQIRPSFIQAFIFFQLILIFMAILKILFKKISKSIIFYNVFEYLLLSILLVPINYMFISVLDIFSVSKILTILIVLSILEVFLLLKYTNTKFTRLMLISSSLVFLISLNLILDYQMLGDTILGYSSIIGARYYGLGNEYMGFFLGAILISVARFMEKLEERNIKSISINYINYLIAFLYLIFTYFIGAAHLGANFGGMITALLAFSVAYYSTLKKGRHLIIFIGISFLLLILYFDYSGFFGVSSHIGQATKKIFETDWQWLYNTLIRKLSMNLKLLRWTIWTRVLLAMIIYLFFLIKRPGPQLKKFFLANPYLKAAISGALAASLLTMFVNDSGVVAAATILFYPIMTLLYLTD